MGPQPQHPCLVSNEYLVYIYTKFVYWIIKYIVSKFLVFTPAFTITRINFSTFGQFNAIPIEGAVHHLDDESQQLLGRSNTLRQEEITEEIEVVLLSIDGVKKSRI